MMRKFKEIIIFLGVVLFSIAFGFRSDAEAKDPCPTGWTNIKDTVLIQGCEFEIDLCVLCQFAYPGRVKIGPEGIRQLDANTCVTTLNAEELVAEAISQVSTNANLWFDFCQYNLPPCEQKPRKEIKVEIPICWKVLLYDITSNPTDYFYLYYPCDDDAYCEVTWEYCVDTNGIVHHTEGSGTKVNWAPKCTLEGYQVPLPTGYIGEESDCYILHTVCNPS